MPNLLAISDVTRDTTAFPWAQRTPFAGLPTIATLAICLVLGQLTDHAAAGSIAAGAAFTVGFAVFHATLASTLLSMAMLTLGIASATLAGSLGAGHTGIVLLLAALAAINFGLLSGISPTAGWIGQQCGVFVIVASYFPMGTHYAVGRSAMVLLGGGMVMLLHALGDLLRHHDTPPPADPLHQRLHTRTREVGRQLRRELHLTGATASYTLRLVLLLLLCTALYRHFHVRNGYWSPMTALLVLKPQWTATLSRGLARFAGTLAGVAVALLLARTVSFDDPVILALILIAAWGCYALQNVNYAAFSLCLTLYIVFLFRFGGYSQTSAAHIRLLNTAVGGGFALAIDLVWKLFTPARKTVPVKTSASASA